MPQVSFGNPSAPFFKMLFIEDILYKIGICIETSLLETTTQSSPRPVRVRNVLAGVTIIVRCYCAGFYCLVSRSSIDSGNGPVFYNFNQVNVEAVMILYCILKSSER